MLYARPQNPLYSKINWSEQAVGSRCFCSVESQNYNTKRGKQKYKPPGLLLTSEVELIVQMPGWHCCHPGIISCKYVSIVNVKHANNFPKNLIILFDLSHLIKYDLHFQMPTLLRNFLPYSTWLTDLNRWAQCCKISLIYLVPKCWW